MSNLQIIVNELIESGHSYLCETTDNRKFLATFEFTVTHGDLDDGYYTPRLIDIAQVFDAQEKAAIQRLCDSNPILLAHCRKLDRADDF